MGLSSLPTPSEGVFILLVANTAISIEILKQILSSILRIFGIRALSPSDPVSDPLPDLALAERFRSRFRPVRFGRKRHHHPAAAAPSPVDCRVCLGRFEPESVVNRLTCGHVFHRGCLEKWMVEYRHATCPLCRTHLLPTASEEEEEEEAAGSGAWELMTD